MSKDLEKSERSLSTLIKNVPGVVYRCTYDKSNETCTMEYLSERCKDLTGYDPSDFIDDRKLSWGDLIHEDDREMVHEEVKNSVFEDKPFKITYRIITKEGEVRWVWEQARVLTDAQGELKALEGFISDITEKVETQKRLEERETKVKELYEATTKLERCKSQQAVFELALRYADNILGFYASGVFIKEDDYLVGKGFTENSVAEKGDRFPTDEGLKGVCFKNREAILVKDIANWEEADPYQTGLKSGLSVPIGELGVFQAVSKKVNDFDDFDLEMAKILASHVNESIERIESEKEKSLILDTAEEHILYLDTDLNIKWANKETKKYSCIGDDEDLSGKKCYKALRGLDEPIENCPVNRAIQTGEQQEEIVESNGEYWLLRASPRLDENGEVTGVMEMALDVTDRKVAENRLKKNKEKIEALMEATSKLEKQHDIDDIYGVAINAVENILEIDMGGIIVLEDDKLVLKAQTSGVPADVTQTREKSDGILGKTFRTKKADITDDLQSSEEANPYLKEYRSGITVPIGEFGVFQAMSKEKSHFDKEDLNMLELLANHISEARKRIQLHLELERSEQRYRSLFEESPISIWEEDFSEVKRYIEDLKDSGIEDFEEYFSENPEEVWEFIDMVEVNDVNKATLDLFKGDSKEEVIENFDEILKEEAFEGIKGELVAVANDEDTFETSEFVNYTLNGEKRYFYVKWTAIGEKKDYSKVIVSLIDITELKETQKMLEKSEKKYRKIFEKTGTAMIMIEKDKKISLANEEFAKLSGYSREQLEGEMKWTKFVAEKDRKKMIEYHEKRRETSEDVPTHYEFKMVNRFGDVKDIVMEIGMIPGSEKSIASLIDITDYKKTFGAMRESQEAFRRLFENEDIPIALIDKDKRLKELNDALIRILGLENKDLTGDSFKRLIHPDDRESCEKMIEKLISGEKDSEEKRLKGLTGDGKKISLKMKCDLVRDHEDNPLYLITTFQKR